MTTPSQTLNRSYGYLWWLNGQAATGCPAPSSLSPARFMPAAPADLIAALGKNDQKIYVVPSLGLVVVRQGNSAGASRLAASSFDNELWTKIMAVFCRPTATAAARRSRRLPRLSQPGHRNPDPAPARPNRRHRAPARRPGPRSAAPAASAATETIRLCRLTGTGYRRASTTVAVARSLPGACLHSSAQKWPDQ